MGEESQVTQLRTAFETLDPEGHGSLQVGEVREVLRLLRRNLDADEMRYLFTHLDEDGSGELEFSEFLRLMRMVEDGDVKAIAPPVEKHRDGLAKLGIVACLAVSAGSGGGEAGKRRRKMNQIS